MTEETRALVDRFQHYARERRKLLSIDHEAIHALHSPPDPRHAELRLSDIDAAAAALAALARDLETAQRRIDGLWQERELVVAALGLCAGGVGRTLAEEITHQRDAAVRAARAETLKELRRKIAEEANFVYEALIIIDRAAREGQ
jgi:hypothetical protein